MPTASATVPTTTAVCWAPGSSPFRATTSVICADAPVPRRIRSIGLRRVSGAVPPVRISSALPSVISSVSIQVSFTTASTSQDCLA